MPQLSDFVSTPVGRATLVAGAAIAQNNLVELFADGYAYPAKVTDYTINTGGTNVISATSLTNWAILGMPQASGQYSQDSNTAACTDSLGNIYQLTTSGASALGIAVTRISAPGGVSGTLSGIGASAVTSHANIFVLTNGNLCITWYNSTGAWFAIVTPQLVYVVTATNFDNATTSPGLNLLASCPLSGGGFAAFYDTATTFGELAIYNNAGALQNSAGAIPISTSATYSQCAIAQISNGNIAIAYVNATNIYSAVYTTAAAVVSAGSMVMTGSYQYSGVYIAAPAVGSAAAGFFAVASGLSSTTYGGVVLSNAKAIQGSATVNTAVVGHHNCISVVTDNVNFWLVGGSPSSSYLPVYTKLSTAGAATIYSASGILGLSALGWRTAYDGQGQIMTSGSNGTSTNFATAFGVNALQTTQTGSTTLGGGSTWQINTLLAPGDGVGYYVNGVGGPAFVSASKLVRTAIMGPATATATALASISVTTGAGAYTITKMNGTASAIFTFKTGSSSVYGNNGSLQSAGTVTLTGM